VTAFGAFYGIINPGFWILGQYLGIGAWNLVLHKPGKMLRVGRNQLLVNALPA
jgi:hypothetical protein